MSDGGGPWARQVSDDRLVALVRRGNAGAFERLYDRHGAELLAFCRYMLGSRDDAEDAVQTTFASAYRAMLADERPINVRPWLFAIARNASLSILRQRRQVAEVSRPPASRADTLTQVEQKEDLDQLLSTLHELPEQQRSALVLAELHGLTQGEIGSLLGVRSDQVKAYIYQARSSLISERAARATDCGDIRNELATARGASLLKANLRRHVRACPGCQTYAAGLSHRHRRFAILIPLAPWLSLKRRASETTVGDAQAGLTGGGIRASTTGAAAQLVSDGVRAAVGKLLGGVAALGGASSSVGTLLVGGTLLVSATPARPEPVPASTSRAGSNVAMGGDPRSSAAVLGVSPVGDRASADSADSRNAAALPPAGATDAHRLPVVQRAGLPDGASGSLPAQGDGAQGRGRSATYGDGSNGNSASAPGHSGSVHGSAASAPGHGGAVHGNSEQAPGHGGEAHGNSATAPGHENATHGNSASAPGHSASSDSSGQSAGCHGNGSNSCDQGTAASTGSIDGPSAQSDASDVAATNGAQNNHTAQAGTEHGQPASHTSERAGTGSPKQ